MTSQFTPSILAILACCCLLSLALATPPLPPSDSISSLPASIRNNPSFNPRGKKHAVPKSSFHVAQGRVRDESREYPGQATSHLKNGYTFDKVDPSLGRHLFEPDVYEQVASIAAKNLGSARNIPRLRDAAVGKPEQLKLSVTAREGEMVVSWLTWKSTNQSAVQYGRESGKYSFMAYGRSKTWVDENSLHLTRYIHDVLLTNLRSSTRYWYRVGDPVSNQWSAERSFRTMSDGKERMTIGIYGDLGLVNSRALEGIKKDVAKGDMHMVIHTGDYGYNIDELQGITGDVFFEELSNFTATVPYQGAPGNHEQAFNFSHYSHRFSSFNYMHDPKGREDQLWWHSFDVTSGGSKIHFMSLNSEVYFWDYYLMSEEAAGGFAKMMEDQWHWIVDDLTRAYDSGEYDWIIAFAHRPMYCSNTEDIPDCTHDAQRLRAGIGPDRKWGWESALSVRPLDLYIASHEHSYERTWPVFNGSIDRTQVDSTFYIDPIYPTHLIAGAAGCREYFDYFDEVFYGPWSVVRSATYGYGKLTVHNSTHLHWEQLLDEGASSDHLWIIKKNKDRRKQRQRRAVDQRERQKAEEAQPKIALS